LGVKPDEKHKTSKLLIKIDAIDRKNIPEEIIDTLIAISNWSQSVCSGQQEIAKNKINKNS